MALDWDNFSAFEGTLDSSFVKRGDRQLADRISDCYEWLRCLRNNPSQYGIPLNRLEDVKQVFLAMSDSNTPVSLDETPKIRPIFSQKDVHGVHQLQPVDVRLGPYDKIIKVTDSASALGYIFSLVRPPKATSMTWSNYFLPLLVLYSECIFLVFTRLNAEKPQVSGVPVMASVMYLNDEASQDNVDLPFLFGSSLPATDTEEEFRALRGITTTWRRDALLKPALAAARHPEPVWLSLDETPLNIKRLVYRLHDLVMGNPRAKTDHIEHELASGLPGLAKDISLAISTRMALPKKSAVVAGLLAKNNLTKAVFESLARDVIIHRYAPSYSPANPAYIAACRELLLYYLRPHVFALTASQTQTQVGTMQEVPLTATESANLMLIFNPLWISCQVRLFAKVDYLKERQDLYEDPAASVVYGRCAEVYPTVGVQPTYFSTTAGQLDHIRGLAMEPRAIGNSDLFDRDGFSSSTLARIPRNSVPLQDTRSNQAVTQSDTKHWACRYPCENCRRLLPCFGIQAQPPPPQAKYDKDLDAANVNPT